MKKFLSILWKVAVIFTSIFILPAAIACIITFDLNIYMACVTSPLYCVFMFFISMICAGYVVDHLEEIS